MKAKTLDYYAIKPSDFVDQIAVAIKRKKLLVNPFLHKVCFAFTSLKSVKITLISY